MINENDVVEATSEEALEADTEDSAGDKVGKKYRERYGKLGHNGDDIAELLKMHCVGEDGKIDTGKLDKLCAANKIDYGKYVHLNVGMQRMTIGNILRGMVRKGNPIKIGKETVAGDAQEKAAA